LVALMLLTTTQVTGSNNSYTNIYNIRGGSMRSPFFNETILSKQ
jgi:hypothetical protein